MILTTCGLETEKYEKLFQYHKFSLSLGYSNPFRSPDTARVLGLLNFKNSIKDII